ncbi:hypothetical protein BH24ACT5_BH24ACT5_04240 [soil metagenome]
MRDDGISPVGLTGADADKLFQTGRAAMEIVGPWMTSGFTEAGIDFGVTVPPEGPAGPVTLGTSVGFAVNNNADDATAAAAMSFMTFWNSQSSQITWALGSGFPPNRTDIAPEDLSDNPYTVDFGQYADISKFYLTNVQDFTAINTDIFEPTLQRLLNGDGSAAELFGSASEDAQAVLDGR